MAELEIDREEMETECYSSNINILPVYRTMLQVENINLCQVFILDSCNTCSSSMHV